MGAFSQCAIHCPQGVSLLLPSILGFDAKRLLSCEGEHGSTKGPLLKAHLPQLHGLLQVWGVPSLQSVGKQATNDMNEVTQTDWVVVVWLLFFWNIHHWRTCKRAMGKFKGTAFKACKCVKQGLVGDWSH